MAFGAGPWRVGADQRTDGSDRPDHHVGAQSHLGDGILGLDFNGDRQHIARDAALAVRSTRLRKENGDDRHPAHNPEQTRTGDRDAVIADASCRSGRDNFARLAAVRSTVKPNSCL